jgi:hypothetical protein
MVTEEMQDVGGQLQGYVLQKIKWAHVLLICCKQFTNLEVGVGGKHEICNLFVKGNIKFNHTANFNITKYSITVHINDDKKQQFTD